MSPNKSITIITGNYFPEDTAIGLYTTQFAKFLQNNGFDVTIITGFPYYPKWEISEEYKNKSNYYYEKIDGIGIFRYKIFVPKKVTLVGRIRLMLSFFWGSLKNYKKITKTDFVFCVVPFTIAILPAYLLAKRFNTKLWIHVQDFEFDLAFDSGVFKRNLISTFIKSFVFSFEKFLLKKGDIISSISNSMLYKTNLKVPTKETFFFPNWVSSKNINPKVYKHHKYLSKEKFSLLYSGNIGNKQDWNMLIDLLPLINKDLYEIIIVGQGAYEKELKMKCADYSFVKFYEPVAFNELNDLLCSANAHFLFQKTDVIDTVMPSKILGMMASSKPSIITGNNDSEVKSIFEKANCGFYFSENKAAEILNSIEAIMKNPELANELGNNGRKYVLETFCEETILSNTTNKIKELIIKN